MSTVSLLLNEIEEFCSDVGISETTFSRRFANDGKFVGRLKSGKDTTLGTLDRARAYIATERERLGKPARPKRRRPADDRRVA